jgi:hypothetical protein
MTLPGNSDTDKPATVCVYCRDTGIVRTVAPAPPGHHGAVRVSTCLCQRGRGTPRVAA